MKPKTARRRLRTYAWKMARVKVTYSLFSYHGLGKKWKHWTREALKEVR